MLHTYLGETIRYEIKYKNRTSIGITIDGYGNIEILAPKKTPDEYVHQVLEQNWNQIQTRIKEMQTRMAGPQEKEYENKEKFLYLGYTYPIHIIQEMAVVQEQVKFEEDKLCIYIKEYDKKKMKKLLKRYYYQQSKSLVEERVSFYQSNFKTKPRSIRITDSKTNWGTCDSNFQLTFNWRLAMAPIEVIDYVVVHEMCHMVHLNHDRSFWRLVGKIMPDYKEKEKWLALSNWKMTV
ncbi:M48 family peptidase [Niallia circulans]|jgi:predicted metal-dependent hydrolase|uniref:M48 family metallopeptidase n=1 Tax=Niallia circulans TaxID=1397 RepID=UPI00201E5AB7|nr:SprT family zinc-dependent metalloprotease [Niallia circulans]UQZ74555.1 M48 family peptidase [Niallia circulans]